LSQPLSLNQLHFQQVSSNVTHWEGKLARTLNNKTGAKCGSVYIDGAFKGWLQKLIGDENYRELDPRNASQKISSHATEGKQMRKLMGGFDIMKRNFSKAQPDKKIDLPAPLDELNIENKVDDGEITVTN
jgi:hypothetical protein